MHRFLLGAALMLVSASAAVAQGRISIDESGIRAKLKAEVTHVSFPIQNSTVAAVGAQLQLEWLDQNDRRLSFRTLPISIAKGSSRAGMDLPLPAMKSNGLAYLRMRYTLAPANSKTTVFPTTTGTVALSAIAPHAFALQTACVQVAQPGAEFVVRVQAVHASSRRTFPGVRFDSVLTVDKNPVLPSSNHSDAQGTTVFRFRIPDDTTSRARLKLRSSGRLGDFRQTVTQDVSVQDEGSARIETDKRLYQPGQVLHMRAIVLDASGKAGAQQAVKVQVRDPKWQVIREARLTTTRYGIVHPGGWLQFSNV